MRLYSGALQLGLICAIVWAVMGAARVAAQGWSEPARGTATRAALMDALRPHAEWQLGAPVQFVVLDARVSGRVGFASVSAQRPGGKAIDLYQTPGYFRGFIDPSFSDGSTLQALYLKSGMTWVAVHWAIGATDVWYAAPEFCPVYGAVLPEICN